MKEAGKGKWEGRAHEHEFCLFVTGECDGMSDCIVGLKVKACVCVRESVSVFSDQEESTKSV